jgi:uncharacterized membrane protein YdjX (TVP38/TMEM64 family)
MLRRYLLLWGIVATIVLIAFGIVEALNVPLLVDPSDQLERGGWAAASLGVGLLLADVIIPVPSSLIMTTQGALFGVVGGTVLGMVGGVGATLVGFAMGRRGAGVIQRFVGVGEEAESSRLLARHGALAILVTRPLPVLAEATAIVAGATSMTWSQVTRGALVGSLPAAALYSVAGAYASSVASGLMVFPVVVALAAVFWGVNWWLERRLTRSEALVDAPVFHIRDKDTQA